MSDLCRVCGLKDVPGGMPEFGHITNPLSKGQDTSGRVQCQACGMVTYQQRVDASADLQGPFEDVTRALGLRTDVTRAGVAVVPMPQYLPDGREDPRTLVRRLQDQVGKIVMVGDPADPEARHTLDHVIDHGEAGVIVHLRNHKGAVTAVRVPMAHSPDAQVADAAPEPESETA